VIITVTVERNYPNNNTKSILIEPHLCSTTLCNSLSSTIRLGSARHLGEDPRVNWGITTGGISSTATLTFYGRAF
jgi:hypothetical protein